MIGAIGTSSYSSYTSTSSTSSTQAQRFQEALLSRLDTDEDGSISSDELSVGLTGAGSSADSRQVFSALDTNEDGTVSLEELTASLQPQQPPAQTADLSKSDSNPIAAQALSKMIAALGERYDTEGNHPVGRHLDTAA